MVEANPELWPELLERITRFPPDGLDETITILERFPLKAIDPTLRSNVWEKLRSLVQEHMYFSDTWWAIKANELKRLRAVVDKLAPADPVSTSKHLFDDDGHMEGNREETFDEKQKRRIQERQAAIRSIWQKRNITTVIELALKVRQPWAVGISLAEEIGDEAQSFVIPSLLINDNVSVVRFSAAFAGNRIYRKGLEWAKNQPSENWQPEQIAAWATNMSFDPLTWDWVASKGTVIEDQYWKRVGAFGFGNHPSVFSVSLWLKPNQKMNPTASSGTEKSLAGRPIRPLKLFQ